MKLLYIALSILFLAILLQLSCKKDDDSSVCGEDKESDFNPCNESYLSGILLSYSQNPLFRNSEIIEIPPYFFYTEDKKYSMQCDEGMGNIIAAANCCDIVAKVDLTSTTPTLEWNSINKELVAVAIFSSRIVLENDGRRISNTNDIVWTWNTGMETGSQNSGKTRIEFLDGKPVVNSSISNTTPEPLAVGKLYSWCVWAWNNEGTEVIMSSREIPFIVKEVIVHPVQSILQLEGLWEVESVINVVTNDSLTDFPIETIYFSRDCNVITENWENKYTINNSNKSDTFDFIDDTLFIGNNEIPEIPILFNPKFSCNNEFVAKSIFEDEVVKVKFKMR